MSVIVNRQAHTARYRGRFAPTPSGPLHFGSIIAAVGSYLQARHNQGEWHVRIEDIDQPRTDPDATCSILMCLEKFGLHWDGDILYQSQRQDRYNEIIRQLEKAELVFPCACTRKQLPAGPYPGNCRKGLPAGKTGRSLRMKSSDRIVSFTDAVQGGYQQNIKTEVGDFVIHRGDDIASYHLCVVADDHDTGITEIVRGLDLIDSTPRQIYLQQALGYNQPGYCHMPIAVNSDGNKLSKQTMAEPVEPENAEEILLAALKFLGQEPENALAGSPVDEILSWGVSHWQLSKIPKESKIAVD